MELVKTKCERCGDLFNFLWTAHKTRQLVCADCLYIMEGIDKRDRSVYQDLLRIKYKRQGSHRL